MIMDMSQEQVGGTHYKNMRIQPLDYAEDNELTPTEFSIVKYVTRHRHKGELEDLKKAAHYLKVLMFREYGQPIKISYSKEDDD